MFCGIGVWSFRRHSSENSRSFGIFFRWDRELRWESVCCSHPSPFPPFGRPSLFLSFPFAAALYPLHDFLLPLDLPPRSKDREEQEHVELKRKRGSRRCSTPSFLAVFHGETLGKDKIHVPPCNYVFLEVVNHGD